VLSASSKSRRRWDVPWRSCTSRNATTVGRRGRICRSGFVRDVEITSAANVGRKRGGGSRRPGVDSSRRSSRHWRPPLSGRAPSAWTPVWCRTRSYSRYPVGRRGSHSTSRYRCSTGVPVPSASPGMCPLWHGGFHMVPGLPEALVVDRAGGLLPLHCLMLVGGAQCFGPILPRLADKPGGRTAGRGGRGAGPSAASGHRARRPTRRLPTRSRAADAVLGVGQGGDGRRHGREHVARRHRDRAAPRSPGRSAAGP